MPGASVQPVPADPRVSPALPTAVNKGCDKPPDGCTAEFGLMAITTLRQLGKSGYQGGDREVSPANRPRRQPLGEEAQVQVLLDGVGQAVDVVFPALARIEVLGRAVAGPGEQCGQRRR